MDFAGLTKKDLTEEDIKLKYITPALQKADKSFTPSLWTNSSKEFLINFLFWEFLIEINLSNIFSINILSPLFSILTWNSVNSFSPFVWYI